MSQTLTHAYAKNASAALVFADGAFFFGHGIGKKGTSLGEMCFTTGITGYQETLTDPSFSGQIIVFTFPHIGNVGTCNDDNESLKPAATGIVLREMVSPPANFRSEVHFQDWLGQMGIVGIAGVDTRAITRYIRKHGAQNAAICHFSHPDAFNKTEVLEKIHAHPSMEGLELAMGVTRKGTLHWKQKCWDITHRYQDQKKPVYKVVAMDFGAKHTIFRCLAEVGFDVVVVPADAKAEDILGLQPDGVFLSNGPGDPAATGRYVVPELQKLIKHEIPIFGICLGHQLLALALGGKTEKLPQGHRGANHPVYDKVTAKVEITSQNHGFVVKEASFPDQIEVTHISLFDRTIEGIRSKTQPLFSVQYHPEASPGPKDSFYLFGKFFKMIQLHHAKTH